MDIERDLLKNTVIANLNQRLLPYRVSCELVDLRSSVATDPTQSPEMRERYIIKYCVNEIEDCEPFFLGLVGHRYGWMPEASYLTDIMQEGGVTLPTDFPFMPGEISVTAFEFIKGILSIQDKSHSLVYLRQESSYRFIGHASRGDFYKQEDIPFISRFRDYLNQAVECKDYYLPLGRLTVQNTDEWCRMLTDDLFNKIVNASDIEENELKYFFRCQSSAVDSFIRKKTRNFIGREDELIEIAFCLKEAGWCGVISSQPGIGKTALLCQFIKKVEQYVETITQTDFVVLADFPEVGCHYKELDAEHSTLLYWLLVLCGDSFMLPQGIEESPEMIETLFAQYASQARHLLFIRDDASISFSDFDNDILGLRNLGKYGAILIAGQTLEDVQSADDYPTPPFLILEGLNEIFRASLLKGLRPKVKDAILKKKNSSAPGYLEAIKAMLDSLTIDDFQRIRSGKEQDAEQNIVNYSCTLIEDMPDDILDISVFNYGHIRPIFGEDFVNDMTALFCLFQGGLTDSDMESISGRSRFWIISFRESCNYDLRQRGGFWFINHREIARELIRLVPQPTIARVSEAAYHYFESRPDHDDSKKMNLFAAALLSGRYSMCIRQLSNDKWNHRDLNSIYAKSIKNIFQCCPNSVETISEGLGESCATEEDFIHLLAALSLGSPDSDTALSCLDYILSTSYIKNNCCHPGILRVLIEDTRATIYESINDSEKMIECRKKTIDYAKPFLLDKAVAESYVYNVLEISERMESPLSQYMYVKKWVVDKFEQGKLQNVANINAAYNYCAIKSEQCGEDFRTIAQLAKKAILNENAFCRGQFTQHYLYVHDHSFSNISTYVLNYVQLCERYNVICEDLVEDIDKVLYLSETSKIPTGANILPLIDLFIAKATLIENSIPTEAVRILEKAMHKTIIGWNHPQDNIYSYYTIILKGFYGLLEERCKRWFNASLHLLRITTLYPKSVSSLSFNGRSVSDIIRIIITAMASCPFITLVNQTDTMVKSYLSNHPEIDWRYREADIIRDLDNEDTAKVKYLLQGPSVDLQEDERLFYLALSMIRNGELYDSQAIFDRLYSLDNVPKELIFSAKVNDIIACLAGREIERASYLYNSLSDEEQQDSDIVELRNRYTVFLSESLDDVPLDYPLGYYR